MCIRDRVDTDPQASLTVSLGNPCPDDLSPTLSDLIEFLNAMEVREDDEEFKNPVDLMFDALETEKPNHFAVRQYKKYKLAAGVVSVSYTHLGGLWMSPA